MQLMEEKGRRINVSLKASKSEETFEIIAYCDNEEEIKEVLKFAGEMVKITRPTESNCTKEPVEDVSRLKDSEEKKSFWRKIRERRK